MKVIHRTDAMIIVEDRPWLIGALMIVMVLVFLAGGMALAASGAVLGGLMMGLIGGGLPLVIAGLMVQRVRLTLDRDAGTVTRTRRSVLGLGQTAHDLHRVEKARVAVSSDSDGSTYRMELMLRDPTEILPFTTYYTSGKGPEQMAEAVNDWLSAGSAGNR
jgi:hypothetical protein